MKKLLLIFFVLMFTACISTNKSSRVDTYHIVSSQTVFPNSTITPVQKVKITDSPTDSFQLPIPTSTKRALSTLPPEQAQALALRQFETNGGKKLPCWLGICPGKTNWEEASLYFATFADEITELSPDMYGISLSLPKNSYHVSETGATISIKNGVVNTIRAPINNITLPELLTTFGPPTEVRILATGVYTMSPNGYFTLVLFYANKGFMAAYDGTNEKSKIIHICLNKIESAHLGLLWNPEDRLTFTEVGKETLLISLYPPPSEDDYIPLEKLSGMDIESFYQRYKDPKNLGICMEMQAPDWP
jgi:hypothetical protein